FNGVAEFTRRRGRLIISGSRPVVPLQWGRRVHSAKRTGRALAELGCCTASMGSPSSLGEERGEIKVCIQNLTASMGSPSSLGEELRNRTEHPICRDTLQWGRRVHSAKRLRRDAVRLGYSEASMGSPSSLGEEENRGVLEKS